MLSPREGRKRSSRKQNGSGNGRNSRRLAAPPADACSLQLPCPTSSLPLQFADLQVIELSPRRARKPNSLGLPHRVQLVCSDPLMLAQHALAELILTRAHQLDRGLPVEPKKVWPRRPRLA